MDYNVQADVSDIIVTQGDTINMLFTVTLNAVAYDMTGMQLDCHVKKPTGSAVFHYSSAGVSPEITISTTSFTLATNMPFTEVAVYNYDVQLTNGTNIWTIRRGQIIVQGEQTT